MISGRHARVLKTGDQFFVEDLDSRNGTFVNGRVLTERMLLTPQDHIQLAYNISARLELSDTIEPYVYKDDESSTIKGALAQDEKLGRLGVRTEAKLKAVLAITSSVAGTIDLRTLLPKILDTLFHIFPQADRGSILLKDDRTGEMIPRAIKLRREDSTEGFRLSRTVLHKVLHERTGILSENVSADSQFQASESIIGSAIWSMMCVPMLGLDGMPIGIISIDSQTRAGQFTQEDLDVLMIVAGQVGLSYENARLLENYLEEQKQSLDLRRQTDELKQYFSPKVVDALTVSDIEETLKPRVVDVTVLFCDIRGFSMRGERMAHDLESLLARCGQALELMTHHILEFGGSISDFQGDAALGYWGWPVAPPDGPLSACKAALAIHAEFAKARKIDDHPLADFQVGIGLAHGRAIAGKIGSKIQPKIGVFGPVVNLASRLEGMTKELRVPILLDETTGDYVVTHLPPTQGRRRRLARVRPYGLETPLTVYQLLPPAEDHTGITDEHIKTYESAVDAFTSGAWEDALYLLDKLPVGDRAKDFLQIAIGLHNYSPPRTWDGVYEMSRK
jgi:adenylate cyclase